MNDIFVKRNSRLSAVGFLVVAATALLLAACGTETVPTAAPSALAATSAKTAPEAPTPPWQTADKTGTQSSVEPTIELYPGTGALVNKTGNSYARINRQGDISLNFVNMDIRDVAKAILGDYLSLNYEISADVKGAITLQTSQPLTRKQILPALEQILQINNMALVYANGIYRVIPRSDAKNVTGAVAGENNKIPGYGIEIIPVHYISAGEMQKLLTPLAPAQGVIHVDPARNILIVEGSAEERRTIREDVALFDTNWLGGMSYALIVPNYTGATELTKELNQVLGGTNSPIAGMVQLMPIERLNAILAISTQTDYLTQLKAWVTRLDRPGQGSDKRVYVYYVQNGRAADLASTISKVLFGSGGTGSSANASYVTEPMAVNSGKSRNLSTRTPSRNTISSGSPTSMAGASITADETNNALVILASPAEHSIIESALRQLDTAPLQVYLEAAIAEITLSDDLQFGVQYFYKPGEGSEMALSTSSSSTLTQTFPGFSYMFTRGSNINMVLDTLSTRTHVEVVSAPQLMVLNNQTATLQVGDKVPIATEQTVSTVTSSSSIVNSIQYQDTGVILKVTPRVNHSGTVQMDISQEVSDVTSTTSSDIDSPTIQQRKISTTVAVPEGETFALGGLIKHTKSKTRSGLPFLQQIPLLGYVFGDTEDDDSRTELMVLITPHVINSTEKARAITRELRRKLPELQPLLDLVK